MLQTYINLINHNRYLKLHYSNNYEYSKLVKITFYLKFNKTINIKFNILCLFFLFKTVFLKNGYFIILNKKNKKIIGMKFCFQHNLMYDVLNFIITNFLNQPEIQTNLKLSTFDSNNNYCLTLSDSYYYYFEKFLVNPYFKKILINFHMIFIFTFNKATNFYDHIFYLNFLKLNFNDLNKNVVNAGLIHI